MEAKESLNMYELFHLYSDQLKVSDCAQHSHKFEFLGYFVLNRDLTSMFREKSMCYVHPIGLTSRAKISWSPFSRTFLERI